LRGQEPLPPAFVLRCAECGGVTSIARLAELHVARRRQARRLMIAAIASLILIVILVLAGWLKHPPLAH